MRTINDVHLKEQFVTQYTLHNHFPAEIIHAFELHFFEKGEYIYHQDGQIDTFYLLLDGKLQVDYLQSNGHLTVLTFMTPLFTIGDLEMFENWPTRNVQALEDSILFATSTHTMRQYGYDNPRFLRFILHQIVQKLDFASTLLTHVNLSLECRLARYLLSRMERDGAVLHLEHRESLAALLTTSVRHLNRTLKLLSDQHIIEVHYKTLTIKNAQMLTTIAEESLQNRT
ncbi:MAG: Crp/Fnr family transcriptional regulator [Chloroflexi bacterium AL-W]|nr:Crp/Fnr family transcriptional regulator [Chloroflexi bacterium AL-N1]NOK68401.1 Crp/Fnr family transcriptional regulator [Chloroflexi bacterium AL-N10]NOK74047.1 Crp/Fnr family transcriptional regulator [Chloroflexi bacterium AL-N5]NOK83015.1 Crp/Fnr family transcriptional regulator [Chloroflexi bacterium AL-W]NOK90537.1 Crp/Fnr family transcriptional regulator [Chloroflexi bacterium AL-N15]